MKSAVDFLIEHLEGNTDPSKIEKLFTVAKDLERMQIIDAFQNGSDSEIRKELGLDINFLNSSDYYRKSYCK